MKLGTRARRVVAGAVLAGFLAMSVGCYGHFPLVRGIYRANGRITDYRLVHTLVMWAFVIIPVYQFAAIGDAVIFNLYEFWTGDRLIEVTSAKADDGSRWTLRPESDGRDAVLTIADEQGRRISEARFIRTGPGAFDVRDADGTLAGRVRAGPDGSVRLEDATGLIVRTMDRPALAGRLASR